MSAVDPGKPVALLARAGTARDRLREALDMAGARVVLEEDPACLDVQALAAVAPQAVLVALEPALEAPGLLVIFDEAELAANRDGWEAQRWIRHLAAKLHGHRDVLPPGCEQEAGLELQPGLPITPQQLHALDPFEAHLAEAASLAAQLPQDRPGETAAAGLEDALRQEIEAARPSALPAAHEWALAGDETIAAPAATDPALLAPDIDVSRLELVALEPDRPPLVGTVLVMAGVGGPDAVRKLLAALPTEFDRAVLVQLRLDGGRYDNLVKQLARVSRLPVAMAMPGDAVLAATVHVLPEGVGVGVGEQGLGFVDGGGELIEVLPPAESAAIVLSGADSARIDAVLGLATRGGLVAGQSLEGCYDAAAVTLLAAGGVALGTPVQLAEQLATHWQ